MDETKMSTLPVGSKLPTFSFKTDICMNCGCVYATYIARGEATVGVTQAKQVPNRAERRRMGREGGLEMPFMGQS